MMSLLAAEVIMQTRIQTDSYYRWPRTSLL